MAHSSEEGAVHDDVLGSLKGGAALAGDLV